jgi:hypothetical protein
VLFPLPFLQGICQSSRAFSHAASLCRRVAYSMEDLPDLAKASRYWQAAVDVRFILWLLKNRLLAIRAQRLSNQNGTLAATAAAKVRFCYRKPCV